MTTRDQEIYYYITSLLDKTAPEKAKYLKLDAIIDPDDELSCELQYFFIDETDEEYCYLPENDAETCHIIAEYVIELREFFVSQNQPPWKSLVCLFNRENGKMKFKFSYD